jgi:hypothetical protein
MSRKRNFSDGGGLSRVWGKSYKDKMQGAGPRRLDMDVDAFAALRQKAKGFINTCEAFRPLAMQSFRFA